MKPAEGQEKVTRYGEFFDMEHLRAAVPVITTNEFLEREAVRFNIPEVSWLFVGTPGKWLTFDVGRMSSEPI